MSIRLGDTVPSFVAETTKGTIDFHQWLAGSWAILFSHPADFTPVCTTELGTASRLEPEFAKRGVKLIALSVDPLDSHFSWIRDINETQNTDLQFPIIADPDFKVANLFGFVHPNASEKFTVRSVVIIGPDKKVKLLLTYPASTGRNFNEILRVIDSLQLTADYSVATPADWKKGEDVVILPSVSDQDAQQKFPQGFRTIKPYLRLVAQPETELVK